MDFADTFVNTEKQLVKALVYTALALGFRAGVRPYSGEPVEPQLSDQGKGLASLLREVFIEYPQKTLIWTYIEEEAAFLDSLPQLEQ